MQFYICLVSNGLFIGVYHDIVTVYMGKKSNITPSDTRYSDSVILPL